MRLQILGSNSAGNCYILENDKEALIIECGVRFDQIKRALNFNLSKVRGCLISHEHGDHCKSVKDVVKAGISVYSATGTHKAMGTDGSHRAVHVIAGQQYYIGSFRILPFDVNHDAAHPLGFLINHEETGNVLFLTDTYYVKHTFRALNNIIVEANFCQDILDQRLAAGDSPDFLRNRVFKSHMSLATCKSLLKANDLSRVNNIVLIHLSDGNSDAKRFKKEVAEVTGKTVHVADAGMVIENFNKKPF
jgi:phosphoribosyl 1,2-cyclic phosphodiesterase